MPNKKINKKQSSKVINLNDDSESPIKTHKKVNGQSFFDNPNDMANGDYPETTDLSSHLVNLDSLVLLKDRQGKELRKCLLNPERGVGM